MIKDFKIGKRAIGKGHPVYIVAEMSANHNQSFEHAEKIIHAASKAGADAIKVQTYTADTITIDCNNEFFNIDKGTIWDGRNLHSLYKEASMPWDWQPKLKKIAESLGMDFFSTPFDPSSVDFLEKMDVTVYKIASFELVDIPLIEYIARKNKPIIMSTGMATLGEIDEAVNAIRKAGCEQLALLKCCSAYPAPASQMNLKTIKHMSDTYGVLTGLSDHTLGIAAAVTSIAYGACIIEKHFTLSRSDGGPDSAFSLEPDEFRSMVNNVREAEQAIGDIIYNSEVDRKNRDFRRSLFAVQDIKVGEAFTTDNVRSIRPGYGLLPKFLPEVIGQKATEHIKRGTPLAWKHLDRSK